MGSKRSVTKLEMLLAVAMSGYYQTTHVNYVPPGTKYRRMLNMLVTSKHIVPISKSFYGLTEKGRNYVKRQDIESCKVLDAEIDKFVDQIE